MPKDSPVLAISMRLFAIKGVSVLPCVCYFYRIFLYCKLCKPRSDDTIGSILSGSTLFANVHLKGCWALMNKVKQSVGAIKLSRSSVHVMSTVLELNIENRSGKKASPVATIGPRLQGFPDQTPDGGCLQQTAFFLVSAESRFLLPVLCFLDSVLGILFSVPDLV